MRRAAKRPRAPVVAAGMLAACILAAVGTTLPAAQLPSVEALVDRVATDWEPLRLELTATMTVVRPRRPSTEIGLRIRRAGSGRTRVDFLSPPRNRGKVILQIDDRTLLYLPRPDRTLEVPARRNPLAGGVLFEDLFPDRPEVEGARVEESGDRLVLVTGATAGTGRSTSRVYFDRETLLPVRREVYAASGRLVKTIHIDETRSWNGAEIPWDLRFVDHLKPGSEVRIVVRAAAELEGDPDELFSEERLETGTVEP